MVWQKKYKKRPFSGKRKVSNTSEVVMYHLASKIYHNFYLYTTKRRGVGACF